MTCTKPKGRLLLGLMMMLAGLLLVSPATSQADTPIEVSVDKQWIDFAVPPLLQDGTTLVQLRPLFEALDLELEWDAPTKTITGKRLDQTFTLKIGSTLANVNGQDVILSTPGQIIDGHTLVPLRFIGEATGATVGWNGDKQQISIYSQVYQHILGITSDEAQRQVNAGTIGRSAAEESGDLRGLYAHWEMDLSGWRSCANLCWDYLLFIDDQRVALDFEGSPDMLDCSQDECLTYEIKGGQLILSNGDQYTFEQRADGTLAVDGDTYTHHPALRSLRLDGSYESSTYSSNSMGGGIGMFNQFVFRPDGSFVDAGFVGATTDGSVGGDGSGVSTTVGTDKEASGVYTIVNHTLVLTYRDGTVEQEMFFLPEYPNTNMLHIGGRDFLQQKEVVYEPLADRLLTEKVAEKHILAERKPEKTERYQAVALTLSHYQWANLSIDEAYEDAFDGYGGETIVALTAKVNIENHTAQTLNAQEIRLSLALEAHQLEVAETTSLSTPVTPALQPGESAEKLAVFLMPQSMFQQNPDFQLRVGPVPNTNGEDIFLNKWQGFRVYKD